MVPLQMYSRNLFVLLAEKQFTRTFAARTTSIKRKRVTKKKTATTITEADEKLDLPIVAYPFYVQKEQPTFPSSPITIPHHRVDSDNERFYRIQSGKVTCTFPGVTHVLSATRSSSFIFALKNWEKNMIKEHGEKGFQKRKALIRTRGHKFHKVSSYGSQHLM